MSQDYPSSFSAYQVNTSLQEQILESLAYDWNADPATGGSGNTPYVDDIKEQRTQEIREKASPAFSHKYVSPQYSHYQTQTGFPYQNGTSHSGPSTSAAFSVPFTNDPNGSILNVVGNNSAYPSHEIFGEAEYDSSYANPNLITEAAESSNSGNVATISDPFDNRYTNSGHALLDFSNPAPLSDEGENASVADEMDEEENDDEDEEDAESLQMAQDGSVSTTREEEDEDGAPVMIVDAGRKGRGKIGTRNGVDVYFNPSIGKWRKL